MTLATRALTGLLVAGLAGAVLVASLAWRADNAPATAHAGDLTPPCSSCDARHARLRDGGTDPLEIVE